ncbi:MFS transporter [Sphingorhabdus sp. EL138]|uniref:spinster family MFS transporter n=1 Tax=Sphingorhabdus sp. EL138 TaxID=2073156 RepID=UPI0013A57720|nr:MFS transporter [Sphingorhabdus sp. EL138]
MTREHSETEEGNLAYPSYVLFVLCLASVISFLDRQIINLLVDPIKADMGLSDTQISLLQGFAFALFYSLAAIPLGRMVDGRNRKKIIALGMVLWSFATALCGLSRYFWQLFVARMIVGIGEATLFPGGFSMLADYFPRKTLTRALSIFNGSTFFGAGLALIIGGQIYGAMDNMDNPNLPFVGSVSPWQLTFMAVSLPGLLLVVLLLLTVKEPKRTGANHDNGGEVYSLRDGWHYLKSNKATLAPIIFGTSLVAMSLYSIASWTPSFYIRTYGMTPAEIGSIFGLYFVVFGGAGVICGGFLADWLKGRGRSDSNILAGLIAVFCAIPFIVLYPLVDDLQLSLWLLAPVMFFGSMPYGTGPTALPLLVPNRLRGQVMGIYMLIVNLIGQGCGPWIVALFTDYVVGDPDKVGISISVVCSIGFTCAAIVFLFGRKPFGEQIAKEEQVISQPG